LVFLGPPYFKTIETVTVVRLCYCEDPFGNIIEIYTHNYEALYGGMDLSGPDAKQAG
jgi:hypothetical protein